MARAHGRVLSSIWEDDDFLKLTQQQQRLYLFLISQPNLNHAGLLPLTLRRWARKAMGLTAAELDEHLNALAATGFIVIDDDTEELLIRSFVRNDGVWKQPKVMGAMVSGAMEIESKTLRRALVAEMDRIPLDELSDAPTKIRDREGPSIRAQVAEHIRALRRVFGNPGPGPSGGGYGTPSAPPSGPSPQPRPETLPSGENGHNGTPEAPTIGSTEAQFDYDALNSGNSSNEPPHDPLPEPPTEGPTDGDTEGPYARGRGRARPRVSPAPTPAPTPDPLPSVVEVGGETSGSSAADLDAYAPSPIDIDGFVLTDSMRAWALRTFGPGLDLDYETAQFVDHFRAQNARRPNWPAEWQKWIRRSAKYASERANRPSLPLAAGAENVVPLTGRRPSTTDQRVNAALQLAAEFRALEEGAQP